MTTRPSLYDRLPEIYRIEDEKGDPPGQLRAFLGLVEDAYAHLRTNIEGLYDDLFIETCDAWAIPYIGDLLGTTHLTGDPWTLRADVADTIALRRRKGTLAAVERLVYDLTRWGVHAVELRERLVWSQHLNHQRPDRGGAPAYGGSAATRFTPIRGGTLPVRDPAMLSLLGTPFDPFARVVDVRPAPFGAIRHNLPNLAIFLWRLEDYRVTASAPALEPTVDVGGVRIVRLHAQPRGEPVRLFNTYAFDPTRHPPVITTLDQTPGPVPRARLTEGSEAGNPDAYVAIDPYDDTDPTNVSRELSDVGLQLHVPESAFPGRIWRAGGPKTWRIRGENLCAWESGLLPVMEVGDVAIDPVHGRIMIGVADAGEAAALESGLLVTYTYGSVGPVGAHPTARAPIPPPWSEGATTRVVDLHADPTFTLEDALEDLQLLGAPLVVEIRDSLVHDLDVDAVVGAAPEGGAFNLFLADSVLVRAADGQRPVVRLRRPLRARPVDPAAAGGLALRFEGVYLTREATFPGGEALIARAALDRLELVECTLDPGGSLDLDGTDLGGRTPIQPSLVLAEPYGFDDPADEDAFDQDPEVVLRRTQTGPLRIDAGYTLWLTDTVIDAGRGPADDTAAPTADDFAVTSATDPTGAWGPPSEVSGVTVLGRSRVLRMNGRGGIWVHALEVLDNQVGCIRHSYFSGVGDRLPQNLGCVTAGGASLLSFVDERFGRPGYAQLALASAQAIRQEGPRGREMGAFGFLDEAHKWRNLQIRFREFMPVGVRPLLIPVT